MLAVGSILVMTTLFLSCSPATEYRVLSFFFDGVPVPPGMEDEAGKKEMIVGPDGQLMDPDDPRVKDFLARDTVVPTEDDLPQEEGLIFHKPYEKRQCMECHSPEAGFQVAITTDVCNTCHQPYYDLPANEWIHGPVALGKCSMCHEPHESRHDHLLTEAMPDLCFSCHDAPRVLSRPYHAEAVTGACTDCHDPHSAGNRSLLVDSNTYQRRKAGMRLQPSAHADWEKDTCATCHLAEQSNLTVPDVDSVCLSCHEDVPRSPGETPLHDPVVQGQCTSCHLAHDSPLKHLIKPEAEKNCAACHPVAELSKDNHPRFHRGECLTCHTGHRSARDHLLKATPTRILPATPATQPADGREMPTTAPATQPSSPAPAAGPRAPTTEPASEDLMEERS